MGIRRLILIVAAVLVLAPESAPSQFAFSFDPSAQQWDLSNGVIRSIFRITDDARFTLAELDNISSGQAWRAAEGEPSSPISVRLGSMNYDASTPMRLVEQHVETPDSQTERQVIVLEDLGRSVQIRLQLEMYAEQPVLRHQVSITNLQFKQEFASTANLAPYSFAADAADYQMFRVTQWAVGKHPQDFGTSQVTLDPAGTATTLLAGSGGIYCTWMAVRDASGHGLFAGWEFDGQTSASMRHRAADGLLNLSAAITSLHHPVGAGDTFTLPAGFVGLFEGGWDQAGFATQKFAEAALAKPAPANFPYVTWDSWGYTTGINEDILRKNADAAAATGAELFIVDLGWAKQIGEWVEDPAKFPSGMRALSDYVHARGMKFGLHFALAEAMATAPVMQQHADWAASVSDNYFGAQSLCLANKPTRDWVVAQAVLMIDNYNLDYILQDGQNMVKKCTRTDHTHDALDSNYANAVDGIDAVVEEVERQRPNVLWENCEDGGNMMTFNMVRHYVTSITNDASGALGSRQGVWGATYPFPPRYTDRYMPEDPSSTYITRSYMFGGPWHLMNRLAEMDAGTAAFAQSEVETYKQMRGRIMKGQVFHLTAAPGSGRTDALESYTPADDAAVAVVTRDGSATAGLNLKLQGLTAGHTYRVRFKDDHHVFTMTGQQLMQDGVQVVLPQLQSGEIVFVEPVAE